MRMLPNTRRIESCVAEANTCAVSRLTRMTPSWVVRSRKRIWGDMRPRPTSPLISRTCEETTWMVDESSAWRWLASTRKKR